MTHDDDIDAATDLGLELMRLAEATAAEITLSPKRQEAIIRLGFATAYDILTGGQVSKRVLELAMPRLSVVPPTGAAGQVTN